MDTLPITYLGLLVALLGGASWFVLRQVLKTRRTEIALAKLQRKATTEKCTAFEHYELATIFLEKKLYTQAIAQLQKSLKAEDLEAGEPTALVYNALGFAYAGQEQYDLAIRQYKESLKQLPEYVTALNNLGFAYERKQLITQALEAYEQVLRVEPKNGTAQKRSDSMRKRIATPV